MVSFLRILGIALTALAWGAVGAVLLWLLLVLILPPGWWLWPAVIVILCKCILWVRRRYGMMVLTYLEQIVSLNLPLPQMLAAAERGEGGRLGLRLGQLRWRIEAGDSVAAALEAAVPEVSSRGTSMISSAERVGRLPQILRYLVEQERRAQSRISSDWAALWGYLMTVFIFMFFVITWALVFIVPKFAAIFADFDTGLPPITTSLINFSNWLAGRGETVPAILPLLAVALTLGAVFLWMWLTEAGRFVLGHLSWHLPVAHGFVRDRGFADVCRFLAEATEADVPLPRALEEAATIRVSPVIRSKVEDWARRCDRGESTADAAASAGVPAFMTGLLATAEQAVTVPQAFAFLSRYYTGRLSRTREMLKSAGKPAAIFATTLPVAWIVIGLFQPLVALIGSMNLSTGLM